MAKKTNKPQTLADLLAQGRILLESDQLDINDYDPALHGPIEEVDDDFIEREETARELMELYGYNDDDDDDDDSYSKYIYDTLTEMFASIANTKFSDYFVITNLDETVLHGYVTYVKVIGFNGFLCCYMSPDKTIKTRMRAYFYTANLKLVPITPDGDYRSLYIDLSTKSFRPGQMPITDYVERIFY